MKKSNIKNKKKFDYILKRLRNIELKLNSKKKNKENNDNNNDNDNDNDNINIDDNTNNEDYKEPFTYESFNADKQYEDALRDKIKILLEERIKGGIGYFNNFNSKTRQKAIRSRKNKILKMDSSFYRRHKGGKMASKKNPWISFLKKFSEENPTIRGPELMKQAKLYYKNEM